VQPLTPPGLDRVVKKCLAKDPDERWQTAHDLRDELKWVAEGSMPPVSPVSAINKSSRLPWVTVAILSVALIAVALLWMREHVGAPRDTAPLIRFAANLPEGWGLAPTSATGGSIAPLAVSPDGRRLAFVTLGPDQKTQIWIRSFDSLSSQPLAGTEGASSPFWSPDSRFLGFFADGHLKKIDIAGGPAITLCAAPENMGGTWSASGVIVFTPTGSSTLQKVSAAGGVPTPATRLGKGETQHWRPSFLPDGRHFLYRSNTSGEKGPFYIASLDSTDSTLVLQADSSNALYSQGHLLFMLGSTLMAQPFDAERLVLTGEPVPIAEQVRMAGVVGNGIFSASANGVLAYSAGSSVTGTDLIWIDRGGKKISTLGQPARYADLELSPDGERLVVGVMDGSPTKFDLWIFDIDRNFRTRFTSDPASEAGARWTADGKNIAYYVEGKGIFLKPSGSSAAERRLLENAHDEYPDSWTPDQTSLLYEMDDPKTSWDLWVLPLAAGSKPYPFIQAPLRQEYGRVSPDGRWVAYRSTESGSEEIYVVPFPGPGDKVQVSTNGGNFPRWRRDGKELFYLSTNNKLMAAAVDGTGPAFRVGADVPLFDTRLDRGGWSYDVSADGQRFVVNTQIMQSTSTPFTVAINWPAGLRK
jgi:Tol biopolymer transport system component